MIFSSWFPRAGWVLDEEKIQERDCICINTCNHKAHPTPLYENTTTYAFWEGLNGKGAMALVTWRLLALAFGIWHFGFIDIYTLGFWYGMGILR